MSDRVGRYVEIIVFAAIGFFLMWFWARQFDEDDIGRWLTIVGGFGAARLSGALTTKFLGRHKNGD